MKKTKKVLGLFLALSMLVTLIAPFSVMAAPGDPFTITFDFDAYSFKRESGFDGGSNNKITFRTEAGAGYSGGNAGVIVLDNGGGWDFLTTTFVPADIDFTGISKVSFWLKINAPEHPNVELEFRNGTAKLASYKTGSNKPEYADWVYCEKEISDSSGMNFAQLRNIRWAFGGVRTTGEIYISDFKFHGVEPDDEEDVQDFTENWNFVDGFATNWSDHYNGKNGSSVSWQQEGIEGYNGQKARMVIFDNKGDDTIRSNLSIPVPKSVPNYKGLKYMSFLAKNVSDTNEPNNQDFTFSLCKGKETLHSTTVTFEESDYYKWKLINVEVSEADYTNLNYLYVKFGPGSNGKVILSNLILSTQSIADYDPNDPTLLGKIEVTSVKVNGDENPTDLTAGENTVEITASNTTAVDKNALLVVALFEKDTNVLYEMNVAEGTLIVDEDNTLSASVTVGQDAENYVLKAFLWDSPSNIKPITDVLITLGE